jgi:hypothetical protein
MVWYIIETPPKGSSEQGMTLGAIDAPDLQTAQERAEALYPNIKFTLRESSTQQRDTPND